MAGIKASEQEIRPTDWGKCHKHPDRPARWEAKDPYMWGWVKMCQECCDWLKTPE